MNVIGYIRVSTQGQARDGYSLSYQQDEIQSYCEQQGWHLIQVFANEGISGAKVDEDALEIERDGFQDMLTYVSSQKVDYVVVLNTSRLWRSDIVKVLVHRELKKHSIDIRSIEQPTYSIFKKDPSDFLINGLMELLDAYQRLEIAMKLGRGRNKKASEGKFAGGGIPFGYKGKRGSKQIFIDEPKAYIVQQLFNFKDQYPAWSLSALAEKLNEEGFTTEQGMKFTKVQVKRILDHKAFYQGTYRYGQIEADGLHQAIL
ncbi:recombinase family protein [Paenibacillus sp. FSL R7-0048]|jgi:site-specific DNA recombinase|uniref:recombinase family protein n=1 Tax=Paenibacillus TaxID=44249 RepID=UPI00096C2DC2|nr:recombinase family protein [Paenibacillus odorifer]OMD59075.1 recombinase family protein [Paenibacillus odorifer]